MNLAMLKRAVNRYLRMRSFRPYERVLQSVSARGDVWMTSQHQFVSWWHRRHQASLDITVSDGECSVRTDLEDAVLEKYPQEYLTSTKVRCEDSSFSGEVQFVIDATLERKLLLMEALQREGITNFEVGKGGTFFLSHELDDVLQRMEGHLRRKELYYYGQTILEVRDLVIAKLSQHGLPLIRIWYHPRVNGTIVKAVFSTRYDVDRAITNMPKILRLEQAYNTQSTAYVRVFHPFYTDREIRWLDSLPDPVDIQLHGEFVAHAQQHGSELAAAKADKAHLEQVLDRSVEGVAPHGGELIWNVGENVWRAIECSNFLWVEEFEIGYYFPYRRLNEQGQLESCYFVPCQLHDVRLPLDGYAEAFVDQTIACLDRALEDGGFLVLMLHPGYFGFFSYLLNPRNLARFAKFLPTYVRRVAAMGEGQEHLNPVE